MQNRVDKIVEMAVIHSRQIWIWGIGGLAHKIEKYISKNGGTIDAFVVDSEYKRDCADNVNIKTFEEIGEQCIDIIVGFEGDYKKIYDYNLKNIEVHAADFLGYLAYSDEEHNFARLYEDNRDEFEITRKLFTDRESVRAFDAFIEQKITGKYEKEFCDSDLQYFDPSILENSISTNEVFIDGGAYLGETSIGFISYLKSIGIDSFSAIYAFEPDYKNYVEMSRSLVDIPNYFPINAGLWCNSTKLSFFEGDEASSKIADGGKEIDVYALDDYLDHSERVTFIKLDVEGSELAALKGAQRHIKSNKPKLAICVYHKDDDLITIPRFLENLELGYKYFLRSYSRCGVETVLYAL